MTGPWLIECYDYFQEQCTRVTEYKIGKVTITDRHLESEATISYSAKIDNISALLNSYFLSILK